MLQLSRKKCVHSMHVRERNYVEAEIHDLDGREKESHDRTRGRRQFARIAQHAGVDFNGGGGCSAGFAWFLRFRRCWSTVNFLDWGDEAVASAGNCLNEAGIVGRIA